MVSPLQQACIERAADEPGFALEYAYDRKMRSTGVACRRERIAFIPLAVETFGGWHEQAIDHLTAIARCTAKKSGAVEAVAIKHFFEKLSIELQRVNSSLILSRQSSFPSPDTDGVS